MNMKKEIANAMNKDKKLQLKCPSCRSSEVTVMEARRKLLTGSNAAFLLGGLILIAMLLIAERPDETSPRLYTIAQLIAVFMIFTFIWNGAFGLPVPIFGNFWGRTYEIQAKCSGCNHQWSRVFRW